MKQLEINGKTYNVEFNNYVLHLYGDLAGLDKYSDVADDLNEISEVMQGKNEAKISTHKKLARLCFACLKSSNTDFDLSEEDILKELVNSPEVAIVILTETHEAMPKPHKEDRVDSDKKKVYPKK